MGIAVVLVGLQPGLHRALVTRKDALVENNTGHCRRTAVNNYSLQPIQDKRRKLIAATAVGPIRKQVPQLQHDNQCSEWIFTLE